MKRTLLFISAFMLMLLSANSQTVIPIVMARAMPVGSEVTIRGIMLNVPSEMGWTCYIQDATGGIAGYPTSGFTGPAATRGDMVVVTGLLKNYNSLLEISPYSNIVIESGNNTLPAPKVMTIPQVTTGTGGEDNESTLIQLSNVYFKTELQGTLFSAGTSGFNYDVYDQSGNTMQVRILPNTNINNTLIPMGKVNIIGCLGQYSPSNPAGGYQLLPRNLDDFTSTSSISLTTAVQVTDITTNSVTLNWQTDNAGSTFVKYGLTPSLELGTITGTGNSTDHTVTIPGAAAQILYARAYSVSTAVVIDTAKSITGVYVTASNSSGNVKAYFNTGVDHSVSSGTNAISIGEAVDDTLIAYIDRAKQSIDIAIYNFNNDGLSNISSAINSAAARGVLVRLIFCGTSANMGVADLESDVNTLQGPDSTTRDGIMHNKFMIIDANSSNAGDPVVWTGSFNWTDGNMNTDANNVVIVQDQSLARTYRLEFEEMWGSTGSSPNAAVGKFGKNKSNNTPHQLKVGGKWVECYFSPSDNVNVEITNRINSAQSDLEGAVMTVTRKEMAYAISDAVAAGARAYFLASSFSNLVIFGTTNDSTVFNTLKSVCSELGDYTGDGIMHNKYLIVDQGNTSSDPLVVTGSHNWTASANNYNDENILVVHDATLANIYYQNFRKIMSTSDIIYSIDDPEGMSDANISVYPNPATGLFKLQVKASLAQAYQLQIFDLGGKRVIDQKYSAIPGINTEQIDVSSLLPGFYLVKVAGKNGVFTQKLVIR